MSLGKTIKKLVAEVKQKTNYGGVQELPMYGIGYDERMQYNEGGQAMYGKDKKKGMMYGGMSREKKMGGGRSMYGSGGYASVQEMEQRCSTQSPRNSMK
jgi:hypothetical protein